MGFLDDLIGKAQEEFWDTPIEEIVRDQRNAVKADTLDRMTWAALNDMAPALSIQRMEMAEEFPTSPEAYEDLFNLLHQGDPLFQQQAAMEPEYVGNHGLMSQLWATEEFAEMRKDTKHDEYATAFTIMAMEPALREAFEALQKQQEAQQALADALQQAQQAAASGQGQEAAGQALQQALDGVQQTNEQASAAAEAMTQAAEGANEERKEDEAAAASYGIGPGQLRRMSFDERRELMERLHRSRMSKLAKLIGSFRMFGEAERRRKIKHAPAEIHEYKLSNDLDKLVPEELNNLAIPELEDQFWIRWANHELLTREVRGPEKAGQGPIIVVCDESGSMGWGALDDAGNTAEAWSKAVALALSDQARKNQRDFHYLGFASAGEQYEKHFPKGQGSLEDVTEFVEHFLNGGTNFMVPLMRAAEIIESYERRDMARPDVVFITDGQAPVTEEFVKEWHAQLERLDARCYGIQVGGAEASDVLRALSHRTININRLNANPEGVQELFRTL